MQMFQTKAALTWNYRPAVRLCMRTTRIWRAPSPVPRRYRRPLQPPGRRRKTFQRRRSVRVASLHPPDASQGGIPKHKRGGFASGERR
ncbi:hypothetical protein AXF42_Ash007743 [Apostasia shenzhenica]|uniref:Uncharacterized protein n=1 Tax=Apostasia shenzhenica TaxID=1088818 RepID=A0A2I0B576_9ASPA|nr:hypothetical protein AXF42_Ash007743 [Apostasia shenzhenica]